MAVVASLFLAFFVYQFVALNVQVLELKQLRQEVGDRTVLAERVNQLEGELTRLRDLDRKLRVVAGLDAGETAPVTLAQGGSELQRSMEEVTERATEKLRSENAALVNALAGRTAENKRRAEDDLFGQRRVFIAGFATLTLASLFAGLAWSAGRNPSTSC